MRLPQAAASGGCSPDFAVTADIPEIRRQLRAAQVHLEVVQQLAANDSQLYAEAQVLLVHLREISARLCP
jgi:hypothetical protein